MRDVDRVKPLLPKARLPVRDPRWWVSIVAAAAGALALGYIFDPERGRGRRQQLIGRSSHGIKRTAARIGREMRYVRLSSARRIRHRLHPLAPKPAEGRALLDRVESEIFTNSKIPHGRLSLEVEGSTVVLRGRLDSEAAIVEVEETVRRIPGVGAVRNLLHLPGTAAPNKVAALRASDAASVQGGWPPEPPPDVDSEH